MGIFAVCSTRYGSPPCLSHEVRPFGWGAPLPDHGCWPLTSTGMILQVRVCCNFLGRFYSRFAFCNCCIFGGVWFKDHSFKAWGNGGQTKRTMINDQRPWAWSKMVNPPLLKHLLGKHCVCQVAISGGEIFSKIGASNIPKKRNGRYKESAYLDFQDMTFFHCVVRFQKIQGRLSLLFPSDFRNVCQGQAFLNGPVENIQHLVILADTSWSNAKIWLTGGLRHFFHANTHVDEAVSHFFSMGGNRLQPKSSFFSKKNTQASALSRNSCEQQPKPWFSAVYRGDATQLYIYIYYKGIMISAIIRIPWRPWRIHGLC